MTSGKVDINGWPIWYEKFGTGSEILLLIPGAIGTGRTDFLPQLEGPHAFDLEQYTIIAIELPGWGRSRPPERIFNKRVYMNDAAIALKLMDILGYRSGYSVIGWSEGARVALVMAMRNSTMVKCLVIMSVFMRASRETIEPLMTTQNIENWPNEVRNYYLPILGDELQSMWNGYIEFMRNFCSIFGFGYWTENLRSINCPVLIFHGDLDPLLPLEHAQYVERQVPGAILHRFTKGGHNCHQKYPSEFKRMVEKFVAQCKN